jgi:hypothetical protein
MLCVTGWKVTVNPLVTTAATSAAMVLADFAGHRREKPMLVVVIKGPTRGMAALAFMEVGVQGEGTIFVGVALEVSIERWITVLVMVLIPENTPSFLGLPMPIQGGRNSSFLVMVW